MTWDPIGRAAAQEAAPAPAPSSPFDPFTQGKGMLIVGGIVILGGLLEIYTAMKNRRLALQSRDWPRVEGTVIAHRLRRSFLQGFGSTVPHVRYAFTAGGQAWEHDHVIFGGHRSMKRGAADDILRRYPIGMKVQVIHSPDDPRVCALETDGAFVTPLVYGISMLAAGGFVVLAVLTA